MRTSHNVVSDSMHLLDSIFMLQRVKAPPLYGTVPHILNVDSRKYQPLRVSFLRAAAAFCERRENRERGKKKRAAGIGRYRYAAEAHSRNISRAQAEHAPYRRGKAFLASLPLRRANPPSLRHFLPLCRGAFTFVPRRASAPPSLRHSFGSVRRAKRHSFRLCAARKRRFPCVTHSEPL